ncbi:MAG: ABC transporter permease [Candidatus Woesearchaeota archaeon]
MQKDLYIYALNNLKKRLTRSFLTILSILIGIMAIFTLVSFGQGLAKFSNDIFEDMGTDKIMIQGRTFGPPGSGDSSFSRNEMRHIEKISGVDVVTGMYFTMSDVRHDFDTKPVTRYIMGAPIEGDKGDLFREMIAVTVTEGSDMSAGRYFKKDDVKKAVLGYNYQFDNKIFEKGLTTKDSIIIHNTEVDIIGFMNSLGNAEDDSNIYLSDEYFEELFGVEDEYAFIYLSTKEGENPSEVAEEITKDLRKERGLKKGNENFFVQTFEDMMKTYGNVITVINSIVIIIALISVAVAAINITNTMYTTVLERTQEIGIMKAIGAKNSEILKIFLIESGIQGLIGGTLGIIIGYLIASLGGYIASISGYSMLQPYFPPWLIIGSLIFSTAIGAGAGLLPAIQASKLKPVDSLRYE